MEGFVMNIKINAVRFSADQKLEKFIETKVKKLAQFYDDIVGADVYLKLENAQNMENKVTEIKLELPGNDLFVKKQSKSFEEATDSAIDALKIQLKKHKEKVRGL